MDISKKSTESRSKGSHTTQYGSRMHQISGKSQWNSMTMIRIGLALRIVQHVSQCNGILRYDNMKHRRSGQSHNRVVFEISTRGRGKTRKQAPKAYSRLNNMKDSGIHG